MRKKSHRTINFFYSPSPLFSTWLVTVLQRRMTTNLCYLVVGSHREFFVLLLRHVRVVARGEASTVVVEVVAHADVSSVPSMAVADWSHLLYPSLEQ